MVQTHFDMLYERFTLHTPRRYYFQFKVAACKDAFVGLYSHASTSFVYEVGFGYQGNKIVVYDAAAGEIAQSQVYENIVRYVVEFRLNFAENLLISVSVNFNTCSNFYFKSFFNIFQCSLSCPYLHFYPFFICLNICYSL